MLSFLAKFPFYCVLGVCMNYLFSCWGGGAGSSPPPGGFTIEVQDQRPFGGGFTTSPHVGAEAKGDWKFDLSGAVGSTKSFDTFNNPVFISGGRAPANWGGSVDWHGSCGLANPFFWSGNIALRQTFVPAVCFPSGLSTFFATTDSVPATVAIQGAAFSSSSMPRLNVYQANVGMVSQSLATSVSADGSTATFNFPKKSDGSALGAGEYAYNVENQTSLGVFKEVGASFFSLGTNDISKTTPFGVDAVDVTVSVSTRTPTGQFFSGGSTTTPSPVLTLSSPGQVFFKGGTIAVGSQPTAIKSYRSSCRVTNVKTFPDGTTQTTTTCQSSLAIVANSGSNTVSVVNLFDNVVVKTVPVGTEPVAVLIKGDETKAYVANYGSSTVSEIDLNSNTQTRVATVGPQPAALAMDPSGTAFWVGGLNYISKLDITSLSVLTTYNVNGNVTSLAVSKQQNMLVYTLVTNNTDFQVQQASMTNGAFVAAYAQTSATKYSAEQTASGGGLLPPTLLASGALVSSNYGNGIAITGTPTGFVVLDLVNKNTIMQGSTPSSVRGIATNAAQGIVYLTAPDSNSLTTVPLPPQN